MTTRYFLDTEFIEDGKTIDLISIGIVSEKGDEYYAQSTEFNYRKASPWVNKNVFPNLRLCPYCSGYEISKMLRQHRKGQCVDQINSMRHRCPWRTRKQIQLDLLIFFAPSISPIEIWGYYAAYDHVAFCQLFGRMIDLPSNFPKHTMDIKQLCRSLGNPRLPEQSKHGEHNALIDARWNKEAFQFLVDQHNLSFLL